MDQVSGDHQISEAGGWMQVGLSDEVEMTITGKG